MFGLGVWELLIILAIVLLLFGPRRLKTLGCDLGNAIKGFRSAVSEDTKQATREPKEIEDETNVIDGDIKAKTEHKQEPYV